MSDSQRNEAQIENRLRRHLAEAGEQIVDRTPPAVEQGGGLSGRIAIVAAALLVVAGGAYLMRPADQSTPTVADATAAEPTPTTRTTLVEEVEPIPEGDPGSKSNPIPLHFENVEFPAVETILSEFVVDDGVYVVGATAGAEYAFVYIDLDGTVTSLPLPDVGRTDTLFVQVGVDGELLLTGWDLLGSRFPSVNGMWASTNHGQTWTGFSPLPKPDPVGSIPMMYAFSTAAVHDDVVVVSAVYVPTIGVTDLLDAAGIDYLEPTAEPYESEGEIIWEPSIEDQLVVQYHPEDRPSDALTDGSRPEGRTVLATREDLDLTDDEWAVFAGNASGPVFRLTPGAEWEVTLDDAAPHDGWDMVIGATESGFTAACRCFTENGGSFIRSSADGVTWTPVGLDEQYGDVSIAGQNVVVSTSGSGSDRLSRDGGATFIDTPGSISLQWVRATTSAFIAEGNGISDLVAHSVDGVAWRWLDGRAVDADPERSYVTATATHVYVTEDSGSWPFGRTIQRAELP